MRRFEVARAIDEAVQVLKCHLPYTESDHVLAQAPSLHVGGTCIEDMAALQGSEAICRLLGAVRLPDPTTGGDFLRRFDERRNPDALPGLRRARLVADDRARREVVAVPLALHAPGASQCPGGG